MIGMTEHTNTSGMGTNGVDIVTVGERGQVVIPSAMRESIGLKAGDKLMVFTKHSEMVCMVPTSSMRQLVNVLTEQLADLETNNQSPKEGK